MTTPFANAIWAFEDAKYDFESALEEAGFELGKHYQSIGWDNYDCSIEFYKVDNDVRLNEAQQKIIFDAMFIKVFINHLDGWETHYTFEKEFAVQRGWRRRYVSDPNAKTTNVLVGDPNPGYYEISYWPEGWDLPSTKDWRSSGYMRIVPDPLEKIT